MNLRPPRIADNRGAAAAEYDRTGYALMAYVCIYALTRAQVWQKSGEESRIRLSCGQKCERIILNRMSLSRHFHWACDWCSATVQKSSYGKPEGWFVVSSNVLKSLPTRHACAECGPKLDLRITKHGDADVWEEVGSADAQAILEAAKSNVVTSDDFEFVKAFSPSSFYDSSGVVASVRDGWNALPSGEGDWTQEGMTIRFDGESTPITRVETPEELAERQRLNPAGVRREEAERQERAYYMAVVWPEICGEGVS